MMRALTLLLLIYTALPVSAAEPTAEQVEFFERRIRPVLVRSCYPCHSNAVAKPMGDVRVDTKEGLSAVAARLPDTLSHTGKVKMPPSGKLPDEQIARLL